MLYDKNRLTVTTLSYGNHIQNQKQTTMLILIKYKLQIKKPTRLLRGNCCRMIEQTFFPEGPLRMATAEGDGSKQIQN